MLPNGCDKLCVSVIVLPGRSCREVSPHAPLLVLRDRRSGRRCYCIRHAICQCRAAIAKSKSDVKSRGSSGYYHAVNSSDQLAQQLQNMLSACERHNRDHRYELAPEKGEVVAPAHRRGSLSTVELCRIPPK